MRYLFIAEKPSLMREVQNCYKNHKSDVVAKVGEMDFVALSGHVCAYFEPSEYPAWKDVKWADIDYPMIPREWGIKPINDDYKKKTLARIKKNISDYNGIVVGTDSDVEGYGIYYLVEQYLGLGNMKALRFVEHSLTDAEILASLLNMTDIHNDPTHVHATQSFLLRARADWLYGMNATRIMTLRKGDLLAIGRVKAPTVKLVYDNSLAIRDFVPQTKYQAECEYAGGFNGVLLDDNGDPAAFASEEDIPTDIPSNGVVAEKETVRKKERPPRLYDLTALQVEAGRAFNYSPSYVLELAQSLYENHKLISYPRTQCRYVSSEKAKEFPDMLNKICVFDDLKSVKAALSDTDFERGVKNTVNDKEVQKESHDALLPTEIMPDLSDLNKDEINILKMIHTRFLAQFLKTAQDDATTVKINHDGYIFEVKGKVVIEQGWRTLYKEAKDASIPELNEGDEVSGEIVAVKKVSKPPKRMTTAALIAAMKNIANKIEDADLKKSLADSQGIGTPATRAAIIQDIIQRGYAEDRKDGLYITPLGEAYVNSLIDTEIIAPEFAAILDTKIKGVQRGEEAFEDTYNNMILDLRRMCTNMEALVAADTKTRVTCPRCGKTFKIEKYKYTCECGMSVPKSICGKLITEDMLERLIEGKVIGPYTFKKKDGSEFKASLKLENEMLSFTSGIKCACGKDARMNRGGIFCECGKKLFRKQFGKELSDSELQKLWNNHKLKNVNLVNKAGKEYTANIIFDGENTKLAFDD